jgi:hypothetical protein
MWEGMDNMKRLAISLILMLFCLFTVSPTGKAAATAIKSSTFQVGQQSYSNDGVSYSMDAAAYIDQGRVFVPLRYLTRGMGLADQDIVWNPSDSSITIAGINSSNQLMHIILKVGSNQMEVDNLSNGSNNTVTMDVAPQVSNSRTYLPARWVVEALGGDISWDGQTDTLAVNSSIVSPSAGTEATSTNNGQPVEPQISENNNGSPIVNSTIAGQWGGSLKADTPPFLAGKGGNWSAVITEDSQGNVSGNYTSDFTSGTVAGNRTGSNTLSWNVVSDGSANFSFDGTITGNTISGDFCGTMDGQDVTGTFWGGRIVQQSQ